MSSVGSSKDRHVIEADRFFRKAGNNEDGSVRGFDLPIPSRALSIVSEGYAFNELSNTYNVFIFTNPMMNLTDIEGMKHVLTRDGGFDTVTMLFSGGPWNIVNQKVILPDGSYALNTNRGADIPFTQSGSGQYMYTFMWDPINEEWKITNVDKGFDLAVALDLSAEPFITTASSVNLSNESVLTGTANQIQVVGATVSLPATVTPPGNLICTNACPQSTVAPSVGDDLVNLTYLNGVIPADLSAEPYITTASSGNLSNESVLTGTANQVTVAGATVGLPNAIIPPVTSTDGAYIRLRRVAAGGESKYGLLAICDTGTVLSRAYTGGTSYNSLILGVSNTDLICRNSIFTGVGFNSYPNISSPDAVISDSFFLANGDFQTPFPLNSTRSFLTGIRTPSAASGSGFTAPTYNNCHVLGFHQSSGTLSNMTAVIGTALSAGGGWDSGRFANAYTANFPRIDSTNCPSGTATLLGDTVQIAAKPGSAINFYDCTTVFHNNCPQTAIAPVVGDDLVNLTYLNSVLSGSAVFTDGNLTNSTGGALDFDNIDNDVNNYLCTTGLSSSTTISGIRHDGGIDEITMIVLNVGPTNSCTIVNEDAGLPSGSKQIFTPSQTDLLLDHYGNYVRLRFRWVTGFDGWLCWVDSQPDYWMKTVFTLSSTFNSNTTGNVPITSITSFPSTSWSLASNTITVPRSGYYSYNLAMAVFASSSNANSIAFYFTINGTITYGFNIRSNHVIHTCGSVSGIVRLSRGDNVTVFYNCDNESATNYTVIDVARMCILDLKWDSNYT
jgi:hypothetical protein